MPSSLKTYRVYYNKTAEYPYVWSIDRGTQATEAHFLDVMIVNCPVCTRVLDPAYRTGLDAKEVPFAWLEVIASSLVTANGRAVLS